LGWPLRKWVRSSKLDPCPSLLWRRYALYIQTRVSSVCRALCCSHYARLKFVSIGLGVSDFRGSSHRPVSVCLSVCLSQVGVLLRRLNLGSHKQLHTIAQGSTFLKPNKFAKFDRGHRLQGRQMQKGLVKIGDLRQITGYISKTAKDRHIVSIKVE